METAQKWHDAVSTCVTYGGHLPEPQSLDDDVVVMGLALTFRSEMSWLGGHSHNQSAWFWESTNKPINFGNYTHWHDGVEHIHGGEDCLYIDARVETVGWHDFPCFNPLKFICQYTPGVEPVVG